MSQTLTTLKHLVAIVLGVTNHDHVIKFHQGNVSCDCAQWKFRGRKCAHLDHFRKYYTDDAAKMMSIGSKVAILENYHEPKVVDKAEVLQVFPEMFKEALEKSAVITNAGPV